jgi:hypothetical protein
MFGDAFHAARVRVRVRVRGGCGQTLTLVRDGAPVRTVPIASGDFTYRFAPGRCPALAPCARCGACSRPTRARLTTVGKPIFVRSTGR